MVLTEIVFIVYVCTLCEDFFNNAYKRTCLRKKFWLLLRFDDVSPEIPIAQNLAVADADVSLGYQPLVLAPYNESE